MLKVYGFSRVNEFARGKLDEAADLFREALAVNPGMATAWLMLAQVKRQKERDTELTGMEAQLRFVGPETLETKIFGRLSAWQNWIFTRANSTGEHGALTLYGQPERPQFQWKRT